MDKQDKSIIKSISKVDDNNREITIRVRKISNGYLVSKEIYTPSKNVKGKYIDSKYESVEKYYKENPFDFKENSSLAEAFKD